MSANPSVAVYSVGWICALQIEYVAACELLDEEFRTPPLQSIEDSNIYTCGRIGSFFVVIACLPKGGYGLSSAATVATNLQRSFPAVRFGLMVGIGGGAPTKKNDIRLGDVVVSVPSGRNGGIIHFEFGKTIQNKAFVPHGHLNAPPRFLLTAVQHLDAIHQRKGHGLVPTINEMIQRNARLRRTYQRPPLDSDILYASDYLHVDDHSQCFDCCERLSTTFISRPTRETDEDESALVQIHYGLIASADRLMKDAIIRDRLADAEEVLCFEMEAAGLIRSFPCLVVRGISDYSDSHKNDRWQGYAAAAAAAYAKELLKVLPTRDSMLLQSSDFSVGHNHPDRLVEFGTQIPMHQSASIEPMYTEERSSNRANTPGKRESSPMQWTRNVHKALDSHRIELGSSSIMDAGNAAIYRSSLLPTFQWRTAFDSTSQLAQRKEIDLSGSEQPAATTISPLDNQPRDQLLECLKKDCNHIGTSGFATLKDLIQHMRTDHKLGDIEIHMLNDLDLYECPMGLGRKCLQGFEGRNQFLQHLRYHRQMFSPKGSFSLGQLLHTDVRADLSRCAVCQFRSPAVNSSKISWMQDHLVFHHAKLDPTYLEQYAQKVLEYGYDKSRWMEERARERPPKKTSNITFIYGR